MGFEDYGAEGVQYDTHDTRQYALGTLMQLEDGRMYRYGRVGASGLTAGKLASGAAEVANNADDVAVATTAAGSRTVTVTLNATAAAKNAFQFGYLALSDGGGENGHSYKIAGHPAADASATLELTLLASGGLPTAIGTATGGLTANLYADVVVAAVTLVNSIAGVPNIDIAATEFGWFQIAGACAVLMNGTPTIGASLVPSGTTPGAVDLLDRSDGSVLDTQNVGTVMGTVGVSTEYHMVQLDIRS
tara:strand:- start:9880 stop:10620 length:741 start_codon:yes stop_codon:yes gene_type:complete